MPFRSSQVWRRGEIGKGWDCNTSPRRPHSKHVWNIPSHSLLQINYCTRNSRNNAIVLRPLRAIASHKTIARTIATAKNYCSDTPCGIHPFSEHPSLFLFFFSLSLSLSLSSCPRFSQTWDPNCLWGLPKRSWSVADNNNNSPKSSCPKHL